MRTNATQTRTPARAARPRPVTTRTGATVKTTKTTLKRRGARTLEQRLMPFLIAVAVGLTALAGGVALARRGAAALPASVTVIVRPGDTIWSLAKSFGDRSAPMFDRVDAFAAANDMDADGGLFPGQRLIVPIADADALNRLKDSARIASVAATWEGRL